MNQRDHVGEYAALYALGALDDGVRRAIDAHVARCDACARELGAAEDAVALAVSNDTAHAAPAELERRVAQIFERGDVVAFPSRPSRRPLWRTAAALAVAAALLIGLIPSAYFLEQNRAMHDTMLADAGAMNRLAAGPHRTAAFNGMGTGAAARVMYGPDGSWYVIVVHGATKALQVAWMHDGERTMLGTAQPHGDVAMLYLPKSHRMDQLALVDGERVVAEAQLAY